MGDAREWSDRPPDLAPSFLERGVGIQSGGLNFEGASMPNVLISGPAGGGKSQVARQLRDEIPGPVVVADFQSLVVAILQQERDAGGRYPVRPDWVLPLAEHLRREVIDAARAREIDVIATNSDGDPGRRRRLLDRLGPGATERIIDPGRATVTARLSQEGTGILIPACDSAISRWYDRL